VYRSYPPWSNLPTHSPINDRGRIRPLEILDMLPKDSAKIVMMYRDIEAIICKC
jgi:hypothetical protein